jgi:MFS family permease
MGLLLVYGLNQWLPTIMRDAGYALGAALAFLLVLNLGAVAGLLLAGPVADRYGSKVACAGWFALAAVFLFLLSVQMPLALTYLAVFVTGFFVFSAQVLLYAYVSRHYPTSGRGTALGWAAGIGRIGAICGPILGGLLLGAGPRRPLGLLRLRPRRACWAPSSSSRCPVPRGRGQGYGGIRGGGDALDWVGRGPRKEGSFGRG